MILDLPVPLSPRRFSVHEAASSPFTIAVWARSEDDSIPAEPILGKPARFRLESGYANIGSGGTRLWTGICSHFEQVRSVNPQPGQTPLHTYYLRIVPTLWLLTQRKNYRIFQHLTIPDIIEKILGEWRIEADWKIARGNYPKLEYKVQYGETDYAFVSRLIEEAGIAFSFLDATGAGAKLTFSDSLESGTPRPPLLFTDNPNQAAEKELVQNVRLAQEVRPGAFTTRDYDFRRPRLELFGDAPKADGPEARYEQYHYEPGSFLVEGGKAGNTPAADDKGVARHEHGYGKGKAERMLQGERMGRLSVSFDTNVMDVHPGAVFSMLGHPNASLANGRHLLVTDFSIEGTHGGEWTMAGRAVFADVPYRQPLRTPKPKAHSVQSATVVGPKGQEIHTDEFGRVRVQFPWDRGGKSDDGSSCWIRVSQGWAGTGFGMIALPRIGQEVLVGFLDGDPEQPIIVGRVYNRTQPVPYKLPENKTISTAKSDSSLGSSGFNEIKFEDKKGEELFYEQAEKNRRALIKHNETITVLRHREKHVGVNETDTTGVNRFEVTGVNRSETTSGNRMTSIGGTRRKLIKKNETERTEGNRQLRVGKDQDIRLGKKKRELIQEDSHLRVKGDRRERIDGNQSMMVIESRQEKVEGRYALQTGKELYLRSAEVMVGEAGQDVTIGGPGGFIRIDATGVTIKGTMVYINEGGKKAGKGTGPRTEEPEATREADVKLGADGKPIADELEEAAKQEALQLEAQDGGHSIARHGPEVPLAGLEQRLKIGIAHDGVLSPTSASTRFSSYREWVKTREDALRAIEAREGIDLKQPPLPGQPTRYDIRLEHNRPIDDGYVGLGAGTRVTDASGRRFRVFSATQPVARLTRTRTTVSWNETSRRWEVRQHYPDALDWDAASGRYTTSI
ncbi:type VI secretion system Vgr family protein [Polyangium aurulentum]|uniref:type VI secretion system Vgr family protein n=1 Tax=Polyangium aurulentum TaxID=2567896 RepID=UPI0010ADBE21|nr:type VI secretion system tip protein TssI/VgrG [Polyangium aurulentum]UQA61369.1 type VI secretion system tip protein VgrG [Polyangium aurulentum]